MSQPTAAEIIATLGMARHPEGGWYVETFGDDEGIDGRAHSTAIYYLLEAGDRSHWHRVDAVEVWHYYAGAPLALELSDGESVDRHVLGPNILEGQRPQVVVPRHGWQSARSLGGWTLVGCTVAPGFRFSGFELAPPDWAPAR
ncbi:cupin [Devosia soli]|uniref:Cupin n=1 Tax=Devosia soli TaxID=361041 RepID=A0A0F5LHV8_9HYPH|nr:cupin domain-containing protein [Devosia soli]KKB81147.1 cupin [Devosia soli]